MFDEENELKNAEEYRDKMERLSVDCMAGNVGAISCHHAAEFFTMVDKNYHKSHSLYKFNCDRFKYAASCFETGAGYLTNRGVEPDPEGQAGPTGALPFRSESQRLEYENLAEKYLDKSCDRKHFGGCHLLAKLYYSRAHQHLQQGKTADATSNLDKSLALMERSCKYGFGDSCSFLGMHHLRKDMHRVGARDPPKAVEYLEKACDNYNNFNACYNLAVMLKLGDTGVKVDLDRSLQYQRKTRQLEKEQSINLRERKLDSNATW